MKKFILLLSAVLLCLTVSSAMANSWGLKGDLVGAVMEDGRWNDYTAIGTQQGDFAVLGSRYHNVLVRYRNGELVTYPLAVWQEDDQLKVEKPQLKLRNDGQVLVIRYGDWESYSFQLDRLFDNVWTGDALIHAYVKGLNFQRDGYGFIVSDGTNEAFWQRNVLLDDFNIKLFPRSVEEVKHLNRMYQLLDSGVKEMSAGTLLQTIGKGTVPVFSAPFGQRAWRAAKGKASVGLSGQLWRLGDYISSDGEAYTKIRYEVSERTQRVGFVRTTDLKAGPDHFLEHIRVPLEARNGTWLTDDPLVSQYQQFYVPAGMQFVCMETCGRDYAYVAAAARNGSFVDGGQIVTDGDQPVWGYVPLRDLTISSVDENRSRIEWDVMAQYAGQWTFAAGGIGISDTLMLYADGTWEGYSPLAAGTWRLTRHDPADSLYWVDVPYEITFVRDNGTCTTKGFKPTEDGFSLLNGEGSGGYVRKDGPFTPPAEGENG